MYNSNYLLIISVFRFPIGNPYSCLQNIIILVY